MITFPVSCILCIIWSMYFLVPCHLPMPQLSCQWHSTTGQLWLSLWKTFLKVLRKFTEQSHARLGQKCTQKVAETEIDNTSRIQEKKKKSRKSIESYRKKKKKLQHGNSGCVSEISIGQTSLLYSPNFQRLFAEHDVIAFSFWFYFLNTWI